MKTNEIKSIVDQSIREGSTSDFSNVTSEDLKTKFVSITQARVLLNVGYDIYVRKLLLESKLEGVKIEHRGYTKWYVSRSSIDHYNANSRRVTDKRRYVLRAKQEDENAIRAALDALNVEYELELAYQKKE